MRELFPLTSPRNISLVYQVTAVIQAVFLEVQNKTKQNKKIYSPPYNQSVFLACKSDHVTPFQQLLTILRIKFKTLNRPCRVPGKLLTLLFSFLTHRSPLTLHAHQPWGAQYRPQTSPDPSWPRALSPTVLPTC